VHSTSRLHLLQVHHGGVLLLLHVGLQMFLTPFWRSRVAAALVATTDYGPDLMKLTLIELTGASAACASEQQPRFP
jgi:hypothetical protein